MTIHITEEQVERALGHYHVAYHQEFPQGGDGADHDAAHREGVCAVLALALELVEDTIESLTEQLGRLRAAFDELSADYDALRKQRDELREVVVRPAPLEIWRCTVCGKWSHAKRKPRYHERFILSGSDPEHPHWTGENIASDLELEVSSVAPPSWSGDPEADENPGGVWVECGPFERWVAREEVA